MLQTVDYKIVLASLSAIVVFIYSTDSLSKQITDNGTSKTKILISKLSRNRIIGTILGAISTAIVQSSSAITSITVLLVSTGFISFKNSLPLIFGSNIGTTITAQLALLDSSILGPILILLGFSLRILGKKFQAISKIIFFLGFVLFSLNLLSSTLAPLKYNRDVVALFTQLNGIIPALFVSMLFTMLIHSSSLTIAVLMIIASTGLIRTEIAIAMILGANVGSGITALLVSSKLDVFAKRTAFANLAFNLIGAIITLPFLKQFTFLIISLASGVNNQIALAHFLFNMIFALVFLLILNPYAKFITFLIKGETKQILFKTKYITNLQSKKPEIQLEKIKKEIKYSIKITQAIFHAKSNEFEKLETLNDYLDEEISKALLNLSNLELSDELAKEAVLLIKVSNAMEQLGDLGRDYAKAMLNNDDNLERDKIAGIEKNCLKLFDSIGDLILAPTKQLLSTQKEQELAIEHLIDEELKEYHQQFMKKGAYSSNIFVDALSMLELAMSKCRIIRHYYSEKIASI